MVLIHSYLLYKDQVQVDQGPPHKTRFSETNRRESREQHQTHGHRRKVPEQNTNSYALRSRIDKWDLIKLQRFCKAKDTVNRTKCQATDWKKISTNPTSDRGLISKINKELKKLDSREPCNLIFKNGYRAKQRIHS